MLLEQEQGAAPSRPQPKYRRPEVDLTLRYRHEGATADLLVPVQLVCNTPDEILIAHVKANSALKRGWIATSPAHHSLAVICGSGPSLADEIETVRQLVCEGATVFALNGAASYLEREGVLADWQVIVDARERTGDLIGPAAGHIFASQVHPSLFDKAPDAHVLHVNFYEDHTEFLALLPDDNGPDEFALVGSHGSVGNVALTLAHAMGFRTQHLFGFDSNFRGEAGHAFAQPMNVTEPVCTVEYGGTSYQCTFTMKSQADVFPRLAYELEQMGSRFQVYGEGYLQARWNGERAKTPEQREADKYTAMWERREYRDLAPGVEHVWAAVDRLGIRPGDSLLDFGCGTGRATQKLRMFGVLASGIDIAPNALETDIPFHQACLWELPSDLGQDWGLCCDVMEHIPNEKVSDVLAGIARNVTRGAYFLIDHVPDEMGILIGQPLHLTVRPAAWWKEQLQNHFGTVTQHDSGPLGTAFVCLHDKDKSNGTA